MPPISSTRAMNGMQTGRSAPRIMDPNDNQNYTRALGINNAGTIVGDYYNVTGNLSIIRGYILQQRASIRRSISTAMFIQQPSGPSTTAGDFAGEFSNR